MKDEQETIKQLLKQQLDSDADKTIAEVEADDSLKDIALPEGLDEGLQDKIKEYESRQAVYEMLSDDDKHALRIGREAQLQEANDGVDIGKDNEIDSGMANSESDNVLNKTVRFRKKKRMAFLLVAVVVVMVLAVGMTSIGGKPFIPQLFEQMLAGRKNINIDTESEDKIISATDETQEDEAYQEIKNQFGFDAVELKELPNGTSFLDYFIDSDTKEACLIYDYRGSIIEYRILVNYQSKYFNYDIEDSILDEYIITVNGIPVEIKNYLIQDNGKEQYMAHFEYKNTNYILKGTTDKETFEEILKKINIS